MTGSPNILESQVAEVYRELGASVVEHNKLVGGLQTDVYVEQQTADGSTVRSAVECKDHSRTLGVNDAVEIANRLASLRSADLVDKGILVTRLGCTQQAREHLATHRIEVFTLSELQRRIADFTTYLRSLVDQYQQRDVAQKGSFISLGAQTEHGAEIPSIVEYIDEWQGSSGQLLTILGEYGSGKTTTAWFIANKLANQYVRFESESRIPVLMELRRFRNSLNLRSFVSDYLSQENGVNLRSYAAFRKLNAEGKLLILLDGFDEMSPHVDAAIVFRNFDEILGLLEGRAKVVLTCRTSFFKDRAELDRLRRGTDLYSLLHQHRSQQTIFLRDCTAEQLKHYLSCYYPREWVSFFQQLEKRPELACLAERPILLNMIVNTISNPRSLATLDVVSLYQRYTDIWLRRDDWRCHLSPEQRTSISEFLAYELQRRHVQAIHHKELETSVAAQLAGRVSQETLDQYAHEVRVCSFLTNDLDGCYSFTHRSISEFLAARYVCHRLLEGRIEYLGEVLSIETLTFLAELIKQVKGECLPNLWHALKPEDATLVADHARRTRAVAAYLLLRCGSDLAEVDLTNMVLPEGLNLTCAALAGACMKGARGVALNLTGANLARIHLNGAVLPRCRFAQADLRSADLRDADLSLCDFANADLRTANCAGACLSGACITPQDIAERDRQLALQELTVAYDRTLSGVGYFQSVLRGFRVRSRGEHRLRRPSRSDPRVARFKEWNATKGVEQLVMRSEAFRDALERARHQVRNARQVELKEVEAEIAKLERCRQKQNWWADEPQLKLKLSKAEERKRSLRRRLRGDQLNSEYHLKALASLIEQARQYLETAAELPRRSREEAPRVEGMIVVECKGLTEEQLAWLQGNGARSQAMAR